MHNINSKNDNYNCFNVETAIQLFHPVTAKELYFHTNVTLHCRCFYLLLYRNVVCVLAQYLSLFYASESHACAAHNNYLYCDLYSYMSHSNMQCSDVQRSCCITTIQNVDCTQKCETENGKGSARGVNSFLLEMVLYY